MAGEDWTRMPLGDFVTLQRGHDLPGERRRPGGVPILGSFGITGWHDVTKARGPGVTVGRSGASFGVVSYSPSDYWPLNTALYVIDFHGNDERFAYYFLKQFDFRGYNSGSAQPSLNRNYVHPVPIDVPPLSEQRAIANILGTLDDKIEVNRRMSATLEAMARALFKAWFVDFEPVRAKQAARSAGGATGNQKSEGRDPGLPSHLAALFPDRLVETEHGEVPEGWEVRTVADIMEFAYGKALKASERVDGQVPVYGSGGVTGFHDEAHVKGPSIIVGRKGTVGSLYWEDRPFFPIDTVFYVQSKAPLTFCYHHLQTLGLENMNTDAAVPGLNRNNVYRLPVPWSSDELLASFDKIVLGYRRRMRAAGEEIETLAALRDTLLPKLISGDLRVKDAEKFLGAAA